MPKINLLDTVLAVELINAAAGVNELLLAGVEGMALRADIYAQLLLHGTRFKSLAANAANDCLAVIRMDFLFHGFSPHSNRTVRSPAYLASD